MYSNGTVARLGVMPRWLLADADRWRVGSAGRSYRPLRTPPISEHSHRVLAIVLHAANALAIPAPWPPHGVVPGLRGDNLPLDARQHQLRFGQGQTQIGDVDEAIGPANLHDVCARPLAFRSDFHQPQNPSHVSTLGQRTSAEIPDRHRTPISRRSPLGITSTHSSSSTPDHACSAVGGAPNNARDSVPARGRI